MNDGAAGLVLLPSYTCASWSILPSSLMVGWPLGVFWKLVVLSSIGSITQCCIFMSMDVSRTSDCVSGDMISRHKMRITWVGKRARHRGLSHDYLGIGVRFLRVNAFLWRLGGVVSLNTRCRSVNYFIIISFSSLSFLRSYTYSHIFVPPCWLLFSLHHRLRFILHFWRCHSKESIKVSV